MGLSACMKDHPQPAGHYFATYFENSRLIRLHFEVLRCGGCTQERWLPPPGMCFDRRPLSAHDKVNWLMTKLLRPKHQLPRAEVPCRPASEQFKAAVGPFGSPWSTPSQANCTGPWSSQ